MSPESVPANVLVMAKAPVSGRVKTRLGSDVGMDTAAELAAAALLDTIDACAAYSPDGCFLALDGSLVEAVSGEELAARLEGWTVFPQMGTLFAERLVNAHATVPGPLVQVGMDTPQATADHLAHVIDGLESHDAVLAPAEDGGWWALALWDSRHAECLRDVRMSKPDTYWDTYQALSAADLRVGSSTVLRDVDTVTDAHAVAEMTSGAFSRAWSQHLREVRG